MSDLDGKTSKLRFPEILHAVTFPPVKRRGLLIDRGTSTEFERTGEHQCKTKTSNRFRPRVPKP